MSKFVISSGHGLYVRGAKGYLDEVDCARDVVKRVATILKEMGHEVVEIHDNTSKTQQQNVIGKNSYLLSKHNAEATGIDVSIHFNAGGGTGSEVLYYSEKDLAAKVSKAVAGALGLKDRGAKQNKDLSILKNTNKKIILIEVCFVDNKADADAYAKNFEKVCVAIAESLTNSNYVKPVTGTPQVTVTDWYLQRYPDVAKAGMVADTHYNQYGKNEGRFRTVEDEVKAIKKHNVWKEERYLAENQDVAQAVKTGQFKSGLHHFVQCGQFEGR